MLNTDFFGFFGFYCRGNVQERFSRLRPVLAKGSRNDQHFFFALAFWVCGKEYAGVCTYVFDFFNGEVGICRDTDGVWSYIHDYHDGFGNETLEKVINLLVRCAQFRSGMIPPDHPFPSWNTHLSQWLIPGKI